MTFLFNFHANEVTGNPPPQQRSHVSKNICLIWLIFQKGFDCILICFTASCMTVGLRITMQIWCRHTNKWIEKAEKCWEIFTENVKPLETFFCIYIKYTQSIYFNALLVTTEKHVAQFSLFWEKTLKTVLKIKIYLERLKFFTKYQLLNKKSHDRCLLQDNGIVNCMYVKNDVLPPRLQMRNLAHSGLKPLPSLQLSWRNQPSIGHRWFQSRPARPLT